MRTLFFTVSLIIMTFFNYPKIDKRAKEGANSVLLGMVLLEEPGSIDIGRVVNELTDKWNLKVSDSEISNEASILIINGYRIAIADMQMPIPGDEITEAAAYNYLWENGNEEAGNHKGHIIVSIMNGGKDPVKENLLYSRIAASVLNNSKSIGIYIGGRTLLLKKEFYLANVEMMSEKDLPLYNWIYFGLRQENGKQSIYTYGLADFNKSEMEIVNSKHSLEELNEIMYDLTHYVIAYDVVLRDGETVGFSEEQKLKVSKSKGKYLEGETLKIEY